MANFITLLFIVSSIVESISAFRPIVGHFTGRTTFGRGTGGESGISPFPYGRLLPYHTCVIDSGLFTTNDHRVISSEFQKPTGEPHALFRDWKNHYLMTVLDHPLAYVLNHIGCESLCRGRHPLYSPMLLITPPWDL